jgi:XTP/dITP diphosphohydrolase
MEKNILVLATTNTGKIREIENLLSQFPFTIKSLKDFPQIGPIEESGTTFQENALIKARAVHHITGGLVLADDSGLSCDDLQGDPGVYSARFAGPKATDEENNTRLVQLLSQVHDPSRRARYICALVLIDSQGKETVIEETCEGIITFTPSGEGGFGYDPYFYLPEQKCTMAELPLPSKNKISHRGKALKKLITLLKAH